MATVLVEVLRGAQVECRHYGAIAVADANGALVARAGDPGLVTFLRSAAKPFQALPLVMSGAADRFGLTPPELAICAASHSGTPEHVATVAGILRKLGLGPEALQCGIVPPYDRAEGARVMAGVLPPGPLYNDCSGKHSGMLATCLHEGYPIATYTDPDHPLQRAILGALADCAGLPTGAIVAAPDGCGVPTFALSLASIARAWATLADPSSGPYAAAAGTILDAMAAHPVMVDGHGHLCCELMEATGGRVVAKSGAEGVLCMALRERGLGVAIKLEDGNSRGMADVAGAVLAHLGAIDAAQAADFAARQPPVVRDKAGRVVGALRPAFTLA